MPVEPAALLQRRRAPPALHVLENGRGEIEVPAELADRVQPGELFLSFHLPEAPANQLTSDVGDEATGCPEYKVTAVKASRA